MKKNSTEQVMEKPDVYVKEVVPNGEHTGLVIGVKARRVVLEEGQTQRAKLVIDIGIPREDGSRWRAVVPFWVNPFLLGPSDWSRGSRLHQLLVRMKLMEVVSDTFPDQNDWCDFEGVEDLASVLERLLVGKTVRIHTCATQSRAGEAYSIVEDINGGCPPPTTPSPETDDQVLRFRERLIRGLCTRGILTRTAAG